MAHSRMRRREHTPVRREPVEERRARVETFFTVEPEDRAPIAALDDLERHALNGQPRRFRRRFRHDAETIARRTWQEECATVARPREGTVMMRLGALIVVAAVSINLFGPMTVAAQPLEPVKIG